MLTVPPIAWIGFGLFFLVMLTLDLGVFHRRSHVVTTLDALGWTTAWVTLALAFGAGLWTVAGHDRGVEFLTGYLIELSLSADNVFVIAMLFSYFAVPQAYQHKVLLWGVIGAVVMRFDYDGLGDSADLLLPDLNEAAHRLIAHLDDARPICDSKSPD